MSNCNLFLLPSAMLTVMGKAKTAYGQSHAHVITKALHIPTFCVYYYLKKNK